MQRYHLFPLLLLFAASVCYSQETLQTVTDRGNSTSNALEVGSGPVNSNTSKIFLNNNWGKKWALSSGANMITEQGFHIYNWTDNPGIPLFSLSNEGYVGVGTGNPTDKIELIDGYLKSGNVSLGHSDSRESSSRNYVNFGSDNHGSLLVGSNLFVEKTAQLKISQTHPSLSGAGILIPGNGQLNQNAILFYTKQPSNAIALDNYTSEPSMAIMPSGQIGIGTSTPTEKLSVNGKIRAKEIKVEASNWPDYVFEPEHKPLTLEEIEAYIKANRHLPEIPSAKEVETNGVSLGEMNKLLLKKIEELSLYLIATKKELNALKNDIEELKHKK